MVKDNSIFQQYVITLDTDWAPEYCIEFTADLLIKRNCKATWFITHASDMIKRISENKKLFETGLHPNFLPNSSHGKTAEEVMDYITRLCPDSKIMRTHALIQSSPLLSLINSKYNVDIDMSLLLYETPNITPHLIRLSKESKGLLRIPYFFEDDVEMYNPKKIWDINNPKYHINGLKVFNFHPIFIYLNSDIIEPYEELKKIGALSTLDKKTVDPFVNTKVYGARDLFIDLIDYISNHQSASYTATDIASIWYKLHG
ncbi:MAG: hypothetical protein HQK91_06435 [Nitrospirae bacterium]|nr:hypothetical protein [Nitrospirota bacterium]MBF0541070.1 hypothetical protein [Nitrospirota bacterium]